VWFFSLDAANPLAVRLARAWFHLPYYWARMTCAASNGWIHYTSTRRPGGAAPGSLRGKYRPAGEIFEPRPGTLEHFLTERYCLYAADARRRLYRGDIHHRPWRLQAAEASFTQNTMAEAAGLPWPPHPLLHFARRQEVVAWAPQRLD
jgi:uncharacterized protein YqjF (DUF2071 family)